MRRFKNILLAVGRDPDQRSALARAADLAGKNHARLTLLAVVREPPTLHLDRVTPAPAGDVLNRMVADRREQIEAMAADLSRSGIETVSQVAIGVPFLEIIRKVIRDRHDLVITTAEGRAGLRERVFGSTSLHLMRKCPCPVWVIRPGQPPAFRRIMAAVDLRPELWDNPPDPLNQLVLELAASLARMDDSRLSVIQVWSVFGEGFMASQGTREAAAVERAREDTHRHYAQALDRALQRIDLSGLDPVRCLPRSEDVPAAILESVRTERIDLLVMGTVCRTGVAGFFIGNTAEEVLSEVGCSVLTVKPPGFVTPVTLPPA